MKQIQLTQGYFALVDDEDYEYLSRFKWHINRAGVKIYARSASHDREYMHAVVIRRAGVIAQECDHRDGNGLNSTRSNLRPCSRSLNNANARKKLRNGRASSAYKGVSYYKAYGKWEAYINLDGRRTKLGYFRDETSAALAYDRAAIERFGEFARLNLPHVAAVARTETTSFVLS